ncbi:ABC transporter substrate-binding protein [Homoserinibacter sp. GY 40078]|uniref:ABC transporter substrate-binding protein n=1 Tax=Homoserinibacter sp. GY 40078 TaxID=2603275 RepID=UPI0011CCB821|nr:ABC transporter substrate-binding protein [Homoserinibacter sp. GY 40078]TXK17214.1 amino acid ABC transporter substrate-binding protein [Homoserinibacter sp. GY 40078]
MPRIRTRLAAVAVASVIALSLAACATSETPAADDDTDAAYITPGKLTIATGEPAYYPYVIDNAPESGEGFEAAIAYAVADELGFSKDDVVWVRTTFEEAIAPGPKTFDINIQQYSITDERKQNVDFSSPYYQASQAVVTIAGSAADGVTTIAELKKLQLGAMVGTTSAQTIDEVIQPDAGAVLFNTNEDAKFALESGQIDGLVLDLPTAFYTTGVEIENSVIVGELPSAGIPDEWGFVLAKDSPLTADVTAAVDALRDSGKLQEIADEWLGANAGVAKLS